MALFFDAEWFDARLAARSLSRSDVARVLGIDDADVALVWKDQRELSARDVGVIAALLDATTHEVAAHAGVSTPVPQPAPAALPHTASNIPLIAFLGIASFSLAGLLSLTPKRR